MARVGWILLSAVLVLGLTRDCPAQASFTGLGTLGNGPDSKAFAVSADGSVVVGTSDSPLGRQAFHWQGGVMTPLAGLRPLFLMDEARDVSADGLLIVGSARSSSDPIHAAAWDGVLATPTDLGPEEVRGLSGDGSTAVGRTPIGIPQVQTPVLWGAGDPNSGPLDPNSLELLDPNAPGGLAYAATADGSLIIGSSLGQAFRWRNGVMERLPGLGAVNYPLDPQFPLDPGVSSIAFDVSSGGGSVVVGSTGGIPQEAFHWRAISAWEGELIPLGSLWDPNHTGDPNTIDSRAYAVSADGRVVVGRSLTPPGTSYEAFLWSGQPYMEYPNTRMQNLKALLEGYGLDLSGWVLQRAEDVSADGRTIVGWGTNSNPADPNLPPDPHTEAWIAVLPPSTATLCGDTNDDGYIYHSDIDALRRALADPLNQPLSAGGLSKCSVIGSATSCDAVDVVILQRVLSYDFERRIPDPDAEPPKPSLPPWLPPPIADVCEALASP